MELVYATYIQLAPMVKELVDSNRFRTFQEIADHLTSIKVFNSRKRETTPGGLSTGLIHVYPDYRQKEFVNKSFSTRTIENQPVQVGPDATWVPFIPETKVEDHSDEILRDALNMLRLLKKNYPAPASFGVLLDTTFSEFPVATGRLVRKDPNVITYSIMVNGKKRLFMRYRP